MSGMITGEIVATRFVLAIYLARQFERLLIEHTCADNVSVRFEKVEQIAAT